MNVARHHAEWLSLVETSGPFVSLPVLLRVFPQGLDRRDPDRAFRLRESYEDWLECRATVPAVHHAWIRAVLRDLLEYSDDLLAEGQAIPPGLETAMATFGETLRPDLVLKHRDTDKKPVLLIGLYSPGQDLEKPVAGKLWKATAGTRMMELLHAADVPLGLVTNGEQWMLVSARRGETTGFASWYADLWMQEPLTLRAFHSLMHLRRFIGVAEADTLPALFVESSKDQQEVTDRLGYQVRQAVEVLIQAFDRVDAESGRALLAGLGEKTLYDSALTVMMRLVFLFSAEERGLLLLGDPLYDQNYAVSTLSELLRERADQHGEEVLERRHDAWCRLLSTFRAVHGGVEHEAMRLPAYGGSLFDPDRFPFLEGRVEGTSWQQIPATPLLINNRVVLHLLEALQLLRVKVSGGGPSEARRLSFRALDIEQIGHVYEGLLDHTAKRASEPILGLDGSKDKQPEISLEQLEEIAQRGTSDLVEFLREETGRSENALKRLIQEPPTTDEHALLIACGQDERFARRVKPFAALLREDSFDRLVVIPAGSVYVTSGSDRRSTGTHYTPRSLTEPIVKHTLEPLVYDGPAEGLPESEWTLKSSKEILALKVCDMAMGSGAFLVATCRYLAERLVEAWENVEREHPGSFVITPDGELSSGDSAECLIPADSQERVAIARRYVADRCLYGVDVNAMAVEMAKLSLWLVTLQRERPFTFLNHALKCGDSLLGVSSVRQVENFSLRTGEQQITFASVHILESVQEASAKRRTLEDLPSDVFTQIETKGRLYLEAEAATSRVKTLADILIAFELLALNGQAYDEQRTALAARVDAMMQKPRAEFQRYAEAQLRGRRTFHWPLEFPEASERGGFDAFVGNPPFLGGKRITTVHGEEYTFGIKRVVSDQKGAADLAAYFLVRAFSILRLGGCLGLVMTNSINEGDTREVGLARVRREAGDVFRASTNCPWPGDVGVTVSILNLRKGTWKGPRILEGQVVPQITEYLTDHEIVDNPFRLLSNQGLASTGTGVNGKGFVLEPSERDDMIAADPNNAEVIQPYLTSQDINQREDSSPSRYIINFRDMSEDLASNYAMPFERVQTLVKPVRDLLTRQVHETCFWKHWDRRDEMYAALRRLGRAIVMGRVASQHALTFMNKDWLPFDGVVVFLWDDYAHFGLLQSTIHEVWTTRFRTTLREDPRYSVSDCFMTFPLPPQKCLTAAVERAASDYHHWRSQIMLARHEGLTKIYNRFHDPADFSVDIAQMRLLHQQLDESVVAGYGWTDFKLGHGFHETKQGVRYTVSGPARSGILNRLLALNHAQHTEEVRSRQGRQEVKKGRTKGARIVASKSPLLD